MFLLKVKKELEKIINDKINDQENERTCKFWINWTS